MRCLSGLSFGCEDEEREKEVPQQISNKIKKLNQYQQGSGSKITHYSNLMTLEISEIYVSRYL